MSYGIRLLVWGEYACFTRPEMKVERVSYDVMTPSAARGILEAIYWKPEILWIIDKIHVLKPIRFTSVRRNEVADKISISTAKTAMRKGTGNLHLNIEDRRQQRASLVLRDVAYGIEAHFDVLAADTGEHESPNKLAGKHLDIFNRRARKGQYFHHPYLGCREFPAKFESVAGAFPASELSERGLNRDLGFMLYDIDFDQDPETKAIKNTTPRFFRAKLDQGVVAVQRCLQESPIGAQT